MPAQAGIQYFAYACDISWIPTSVGKMGSYYARCSSPPFILT